ncbi:MAG: hypothetical protein IT531_04235 [Burkholderiales bacterium]|nr:hypothetical protein [Burkholderiales bacterium]
MKDANSSTRIKSGDQQPGEAPPPPQPDKAHRAEPGSAQHHDNQQELGVTQDHFTTDMKRHKRGTFP